MVKVSDNSNKPPQKSNSRYKLLQVAKVKVLSIYNKLVRYFHKEPSEQGQEQLSIEDEEEFVETEPSVEEVKYGLFVPKDTIQNDSRAIGFDLDGSILDTYVLFYQLVGKDRRWSIISPDLIRSPILQKNAKLTQEEINYYLKRVYESPDLNLVDSRICGIIHNLRKDFGYKVEIITASIASKETIARVLRERNVEFDEIKKVQRGEDKSTYTNARIMVDDVLPRALDFAKKEGNVGILLLRPWNLDFVEKFSAKTEERQNRLFIVADWEEVGYLLSKLVRKADGAIKRSAAKETAKVR